MSVVVNLNKHAMVIDYGDYVIQVRPIATNQRWDAVYRITKNGQTAKAWTKSNAAGLPDAESACKAGIAQAKADVDQGLLEISA